MSSRQAGGERTVDDFTMIALLLLGSLVAAWFLWIAFQPQISMAYTYVRRVELWWLEAMGHLGIPGAEAVTRWFQRGCAATGWFDACTRDFKTMGWKEISALAFYVNLLLLPFILWFAFRIFAHVQSRHPNLTFAKTLTVDGFVRAKKKIYPHLRMFDELDLINASLTDPVLGMSLTSRQFIFQHRLVMEAQGEGKDGWIDEPDGSCTPVLNRKKVEGVLKAQLGKLWTSMNDLSTSEMLLFAIALPRVAATEGRLDDKAFKQCLAESDDMLNWCWDLFKPQPKDKKAADAKEASGAGGLGWLKPDVPQEKPRAIIARHIDCEPMRAILAKHAYVRTILFAMFIEARSLGVLPPAEMRWLRFFDRELWYVVQNFGRQGAFVEGSAVHIHYLYEVKSGQPLVEPQLDKAINALEEAVTAFKYRPEDRDAYRASKPTIAEAVPESLTGEKPQSGDGEGKKEQKNQK